jgi:hypothetical protein
MLYKKNKKALDAPMKSPLSCMAQANQAERSFQWLTAWL